MMQIMIQGRRGEGTTSFLLSLLSYYERCCKVISDCTFLYFFLIMKWNIHLLVATTFISYSTSLPTESSSNATTNTSVSLRKIADKPLPQTWAKHDSNTKEKLIQWLIEGCNEVCFRNLDSEHQKVEYEGYDGYYNNLARPDLGAVDTPLLRRWPAAYKDGVYQPRDEGRPEPLELSENLLKSYVGKPSITGKNALLVFFGQQVVEEILDAQRAACPPEYFNIRIPPNHTMYGSKKTMMPVLRTRYDMHTGFSPNNPRQQLNEITPWLDGGLIYGTTKTWADHLRMNDNGTLDPDGLLLSSEDGRFPAENTIRLPMANPPPPFHHKMFTKNHETLPVSRFFRLGNPRGNENPYLLTFGILWFRWHNHIARFLRKDHPEWSGERVYNEARKWVIATQQHIVVNTWLKEWLGEELPPYKGYDPSVDPQIDQFFQAAAFRFGHTLVTPGVILRDYSRNGCGTVTSNAAPNATIRTCNSFWRPQDFIDGTVDIDHVLMGMAFQLCERDDNEIVEDLRGNVFGPLEFSRRDLMALNIQRGRDHGLPDYNSARKAFGLKVINDTNHFPALRNEKIRDAFMRLHNNSFDDIDVWVGGILETDNGPGELFRTIIKDQFTRIRNGDRFWYANHGNNLFTEEERKRIEALTIYDIILSVTKMDYNDIQPNPFTAPDSETVTLLGSSCTSRLTNNKIECFKKLKNKSETCYFLYVNISSIENCTELETYDYFSSSELPYIFTYIGIGTIIFGFVGTFCLLIKFKQRKQEQESQRRRTRDSFYDGSSTVVPYSASEWIDRKSPLRPVVIIFDKEKKQIQVRNQIGQLLRVMDLTHNALVTTFVISDGHHVILRVSNDYDLVLRFDGPFLRNAFMKKFEEFTDEIHKVKDCISMNLSQALRQAVTRKDRQKRLDMFFRVVFSQAFSISHSEDETLNLDSKLAREIIYTELTMNEFAEALSMPAKSEFVRKMFDLVDKDKNGFISFREFADMLVTFYKGTAEDKAKLMFDMYDINGTGQLTLADFKNMIRSLMETSNADVSQTDLDTAINAILKSAGLAHKEIITVRNFQQLLVNYKGKLGIEELNFTNLPTSSKRQSYSEQVRASAFSIYGDLNDIKAGNDEETKKLESQIDNDQDMILAKKSDVKSPVLQYILGNFEKYAREIFWMLLYTLVLLAVFAERAYYYSVEREHSGLRRIAGYGVTVTRGAASAMMFTYSTLLVTMCRNTITILRDTALHVYIPFDSAVEFHKYVAWWALFFTVMHTIGHAFNFYSISTQTSDDLTCLFRNFYHATHEIPKFHYWCWGTITGITGVLLVFLTAVIFIFALPFSRRNNYNAFWLTHSLYPVFFILMILHGAGRLIQPPFFYYFFLGPCILFTIDKIISVRRKKVEIPVVKAELLPSNVTYLEFKKPSNFEYKSGQWVRIACTALNSNEYHPFTLSSAPHERNLTVHIRAVGPWTNSIRSIYDPTILREMPLPKIHLDGPYGEGHQDWYQFEVAILIGGGIGVTPFASILKDIVFRSSIKHKAACKKVYFLWVTKTQKQFEWLVDMIREVEKRDEDRVVSIHIFITQFYQKFDLRTVLLYLCERHFQKVCDRSLLTGLRAVTHFGRPNFFHIFECIQSLKKQTRTVGVFSCGPQPMMQMVDKACAQLNKQTYDGPIFQHHFKNF